MYYFYFPYVFILSGAMLFDCFRRKQPLWWAAMVLFAPVTAPYFIFKSRRTEGLILFMVFMATFSMVVGVEIYTWAKYKERNKYAHLPPIVRETIRFSDILKQTTQDLDKALVELEEMSKKMTSPGEAQDTLAFIKIVREAETVNQEAVTRLARFTQDYQSYFVKQELSWVYQIKEFYTSRKVIIHQRSLNQYLNAFEAMLRYIADNFDQIMSKESNPQKKNYDEYYIRYRRAVDRHNKFNVMRIEFQNEFSKKHPGVSPYLPGTRQTETFKLWQ